MSDAASRKRSQDGRQQRADGERSRLAILKAASELATVEGLGGLSIARLADHVGMSKSGLFAHFRSKEELQLATIDTACATFQREVVDPSMGQPPGLARLNAFCEAFFQHLERGTFPGGCFFISVASEFDAKNGPVRDYVLTAYSQILEKFNEMVREAQALQELDSREDPAQLAFELDSYMLCVNFGRLFFRDPAAMARGREAIRQRLARAIPAKRVTQKSPLPSAPRPKTTRRTSR
jgi:AcrR family transcriptional regulator